MSAIGRHTTYATWTVEELIDATSREPRGNKKVTIPEFQRRIVWSKQKQEDLVTSIKKGYPFGSLLLARGRNSQSSTVDYKLIDGLQRTQTLRKYASQPNNSFTATELTDEFVNIVARSLNDWSDFDCVEEPNITRLKRKILEWVWDSQGFTEEDGWSASSLADKLLRDLLELEVDSYDYYIAHRELSVVNSVYYKEVRSFLDSIRSDSDIGRVEVPVIIFAGPQSELAHIFTILNTQGIKLTRYEIYAAQWLDYRYRIDNLEIIEAIWRKYEALESHGFNLDVAAEAPDKESRINREYTLFEYVFGLGQCLTQNYEAFFRPVKVDKPSPVGFNLLSACVGAGVADKDLKRLPEEIRGLELSRLEQRLIESVEFVYQVMKPVLSYQRVGSNKLPYFHSDLQIASMIATAFQVRYDISDLSELEGWEEKRSTLGKSLPMHFLLDILQDSWRGSGDSKLKEVVSSMSYLDPLPPENIWRQVLNIWHENHIKDRVHKKNYLKDDFPEYLLLRYVMANRVQNSEGFHVLHIVPISRLISPPSYYHQYEGPINSIGNLAIVAVEDFVDYGDHTFIEHLKRLQSDGRYGTIQYHEELELHEKKLVCNATDLPSLALRKREFEEFLANRFASLKAEFIRAWSDYIPSDPQA